MTYTQLIVMGLDFRGLDTIYYNHVMEYTRDPFAGVHLEAMRAVGNRLYIRSAPYKVDTVCSVNDTHCEK